MKSISYKAIGISILPIALTSTLSHAQPESTWTLDGSVRLRYENLHNAYRKSSNGDDQLLTSHSLVSLKAEGGVWIGEIEMSDQRAWLDDAGTPLGTDDVNALEPLQAWVGWNPNDQFTAKAGRITLDLGSRRLMARQRYRNTISAFDGFHTSYQQDNWQLQSFYLAPVDRRPSDRASLDDNKFKIDKQSDDRFWGFHFNYRGSSNLELYYYDLDEPSPWADIATIGFRNYTSAKPDTWHYEIEAAYQSGDYASQDVSASMAHAHIGYQFTDPLSSRVELIFDYASGDDDPNDNKRERFDPLFGVSRPDFGPTGIYGAFQLSNVIAAGSKWSFMPGIGDSAFIKYQALWLDSETDTQSRSGLRDISGNSGRFAGHQIDARWRITVKEQFQLEMGATHLFKGEFLEDVFLAPDDGDSTYVYSQVTYRF